MALVLRLVRKVTNQVKSENNQTKDQLRINIVITLLHLTFIFIYTVLTAFVFIVPLSLIGLKNYQII